MDLRAIVLLGASGDDRSISAFPAPAPAKAKPEHLMGIPMGALDLLGQPIVCHVIDRLRSHGISEVTVVAATANAPAGMLPKWPPHTQCIETASDNVWAVTEEVLLRLSSERAEAVVVLRLGPYVEVDFRDLLSFHLARRNALTRVCDHLIQPLDIVAVDPLRKKEAVALLRGKMHHDSRGTGMFPTHAYVNLLRDGEDFRGLAEDALMRRCALIPRGKEVKPGLWVGKNAKIHRSATLAAPAYIGDHAKIRHGVVVTGCSALEHHCEVSQSTLIDNSSLLPYSYVGESLDFVQAVVGFSQVSQVKRNITVSIADPNLTKMISASPLKQSMDLVRSVASKFLQGSLSGSAKESHHAAKSKVSQGAASSRHPGNTFRIPPQGEPDPLLLDPETKPLKAKQRATHN